MSPGPLLGADKEYTIKAAFIEKLIRFIDWPQPLEDGARRKELMLCVIGNHPFRAQLDQLAALTADSETPYRVSYFDRPAEIRGCDALFIARSERRRLHEILRHAKSGNPMLTFGDTPGYAQRGVIINFYVEGGRVRFEINKPAADDAGFSISARVLKLARIVEQ